MDRLSRSMRRVGMRVIGPGEWDGEDRTVREEFRIYRMMDLLRLTKPPGYFYVMW